MKISESWLREWVNPTISTTELAEQLTMAGLEVDSVESAAPAFSKVVVAEVVDVTPHPDADKLRVCQVNTGAEENLQIVCGASNVRAGLHVAAAVVGARLPGDFKIKKSKLRGVQSLGMLCGASELGLEESSDGLLELPDNAPIGADIREYMNLDDQIIEVDLTPNRGDCLSIAGIAREVAVLNSIEQLPQSFSQVTDETDTQFPLTIEAEQDCPKYLGRIIEGINVDATTPDWLQQRLQKSGLRPISPVVDVTNYVMLELGQPMHAFDLAKLDQGIIVRRAQDKEKLTLLDEKEIELSTDDVVIADQSKVLALAGIMGGLESAVTDSSTDIFLECAYFQPTSIAGKARNFGMQTDSSYRFERGVDPQQLDRAMQRASELLLDICGGKAGPIQQVIAEQHLPQTNAIVLRHQQLERILGISLEADMVEDILTRLGMSVSQHAQGWQVTAPSFRFDIAIEADLIEEVGRIYGYNQLPTKAFVGAMHMPTVSEFEQDQHDLHQRLFDRGYQEVITYSFVDPDAQRVLDPDAEAIALANPISADMSVMRTQLWTGLVQTVDYNIKRQQEQLKLFEYGLKYIRQDDDIKQINVLSGAICGSQQQQQWGEPSRQVDFYDLKADVEAILAMTAMQDQFQFIVDRHPALHPGQCARIDKDGEAVGWIGMVHPQVLNKLGIKANIFVFELAWEALATVKLPSYKALSKYPSIRRDLAIVVDEQVVSQQIIDVIRDEIGEILVDLRIFDIYRGKGVDSGRKSVALGLILQESSRTLTDQDVEDTTAKVVLKLEKELGATLRD